MLTADGPKVVEYNAQRDPDPGGDPPDRGDLLRSSSIRLCGRHPWLTWTSSGRTGRPAVWCWPPGGYPLSYEKGYEISGQRIRWKARRCSTRVPSSARTDIISPTAVACWVSPLPAPLWRRRWARLRCGQAHRVEGYSFPHGHRQGLGRLTISVRNGGVSGILHRFCAFCIESSDNFVHFLSCICFFSPFFVNFNYFKAEVAICRFFRENFNVFCFFCRLQSGGKNVIILTTKGMTQVIRMVVRFSSAPIGTERTELPFMSSYFFFF